MYLLNTLQRSYPWSLESSPYLVFGYLLNESHVANTDTCISVAVSCTLSSILRLAALCPISLLAILL